MIDTGKINVINIYAYVDVNDYRTIVGFFGRNNGSQVYAATQMIWPVNSFDLAPEFFYSGYISNGEIVHEYLWYVFLLIDANDQNRKKLRISIKQTMYNTDPDTGEFNTPAKYIIFGKK